MIFVGDDDIQELTGYKRHSAQRRWLLRNGYRFEVRADGRPILLLAEVERHMLGKSKTKRTEPNWNARGFV